MVHKRLIVFFYLFAALSLLLFTYQCTTNQETDKKTADTTNSHTWLNLGDSATYVGMNNCRQCHSDIYESFRQTGMGQSFGLANKSKSAGIYPVHQPVYDKFSDLYYIPYLQDSQMMLKEYRLKGKDTIHKRIEKLDYIVGSGHHTNSHILNQNGYLHQAPITFYVQQNKWDLPPGFEQGYNTRFSRALGLECLSCHNAYPDFVKESFNKYANVPLGIDCERCHGPGSLHVKKIQKGIVVDIKHDTDFTIVNPRKLPYDLQIDVCQRCHLQGDAVLKEGKTFFDFRPGMKLSSVMDVFLPAYEEDEKGFLMAAHAQRLRKSPCFLKSNEEGARKSSEGHTRLNCITCHNPHVSVKFTKDEYFIKKCQGCHESPHDCKAPEKLRMTKNNNCVTCHMPKSGTVDIPHVQVTDHFIRVVKEQPKTYKPGVGKFKGLECMTTQNPDALTLAKAYLFFYEKFEHKPYNLDSAYKYLKQFPEQSKPEEYIYYYFLKENYAAITVLASKIKKNFIDPVTNYQVGQAYLNQDQHMQAVIYLQKAVDQQPYNLDYRNKLGTTYLYLQQFEKAAKEFNFAMKENPKIAATWNNLGFLFLVQQNIPKAEEYFEKALALDPDYEFALINRAKLYMLQNNTAKAVKQLNEILKKHPDNQDARQLILLLDNK